MKNEAIHNTLYIISTHNSYIIDRKKKNTIYSGCFPLNYKVNKFSSFFFVLAMDSLSIERQNVKIHTSYVPFCQYTQVTYLYTPVTSVHTSYVPLCQYTQVTYLSVSTHKLRTFCQYTQVTYLSVSTHKLRTFLSVHTS